MAWIAVVLRHIRNSSRCSSALSAAAVVAFTGWFAYIRRHSGQRYIIITSALILMSLFIAAGVDLITVKNDIGRQNTIFKFYIQARWLLAIAATRMRSGVFGMSVRSLHAK